VADPTNNTNVWYESAIKNDNDEGLATPHQATHRTITFIKSTSNWTFGGFTTKTWRGNPCCNQGLPKSDAAAFIFTDGGSGTFTKYAHRVTRTGTNAIIARGQTQKMGPAFGGGLSLDEGRKNCVDIKVNSGLSNGYTCSNAYVMVDTKLSGPGAHDSRHQQAFDVSDFETVVVENCTAPPTNWPTASPTASPSASPTATSPIDPTQAPTYVPTKAPTKAPTVTLGDWSVLFSLQVTGKLARENLHEPEILSDASIIIAGTTMQVSGLQV
jgi:hypothetical protein